MRLLNNLNIAINSICKKLLFSFLLIVQLTASLYLLYNTIFINGQASNNINKIQGIFNSTNIFAVNSVDEFDNLFGIKFQEKDIIPRLKEFDEFLNNSKEFTRISFNNESIPIEQFSGYEHFENATAPKYSYNNKDFSRLNALQGDKNFFSHFKFNISSGRNFQNSDFENNNSLPVILGSDYSNIFKVNDILHYYDEISDSEKNMEIIGFLEKDSFFFQSNFEPNNVYNMDNYIICPINRFKYLDSTSANYEALLRNMYFSNLNNTLLISDYDSDFLQNFLQKKSTSLNLYNLDVQSGEKMLSSYKDMYKTQRHFLLILFFIVLLFTSINMISSLLNYINKNKKEFAIHIMCGATISDLVQRIFLQIFTLMSISFGFMIFVSYSFNKNSVIPYLNSTYILQTALISIVLVLLLIIIPVIKLLSIDLTNIIKED